MYNEKDFYKFIAENISAGNLCAAKVIGKISAFICNQRNYLKMTREEFAKRVGVSLKTVSKWESADYNFSVEEIAKIAEALGAKVDINFVVEEKSESVPNEADFGYKDVIKMLIDSGKAEEILQSDRALELKESEEKLRNFGKERGLYES